MSLANEYREVRLTIDGGFSHGHALRLPVRCEGSLGDDGRAFTIHSVWVDVGNRSYDIFDSIDPRVITSLEEQAEDQMQWEGV